MLNLSKTYRFFRINQLVLLFSLCGLATSGVFCEELASSSTLSSSRYQGKVGKESKPNLSSSGIFNVGGKILLDRSLEVTQGLQSDKFLDLVGASSATAPTTGHYRIWFDSAAALAKGIDVNGTITALAGGTISGVTAGGGLKGGGASGSVTLSVDPSSVTLQANTFNGASQLVQLNSSSQLPTASGVNLTNLNASNLASGTVADARLDNSSVTLQGNTFNGNSQLVQTNSSGQLPTISGVNLTGLKSSMIAGTTTNDNATTGNIGQYVTSWVGATNAPTTGQWGDLTSVSLGSGDWDVTVVQATNLNGATLTRVVIGVGKTSGNNGPDITGQFGDDQTDVDPGNGTNPAGGCVANVRVSLASTTTVYYKMFATYTGGPFQFRGRISARRVR